jgi:hypothetical protein
MLPTKESKDKKNASKTMENKIPNLFFLKRLSDRDVKIMFIDTSCRIYVQQRPTAIGFIYRKYEISSVRVPSCYSIVCVRQYLQLVQVK